MSFKFSQHLGIAKLELKAPAQLHARAWFENIRLRAEHGIVVVMKESQAQTLAASLPAWIL